MCEQEEIQKMFAKHSRRKNTDCVWIEIEWKKEIKKQISVTQGCVNDT